MTTGELKSCPLCVGEAEHFPDNEHLCYCINEGCLWCNESIPVDAWQSLPRPSSEARAIARRLAQLSVAGESDDGLSVHFPMDEIAGLRDRLLSISDGGTGGEVWVMTDRAARVAVGMTWDDCHKQTKNWEGYHSWQKQVHGTPAATPTETWCACGSPLCDSVRDGDEPGHTIVGPCASCIDLAREEGRDEGWAAATPKVPARVWANWMLGKVQVDPPKSDKGKCWFHVEVIGADPQGEGEGECEYDQSRCDRCYTHGTVAVMKGDIEKQVARTKAAEKKVEKVRDEYDRVLCGVIEKRDVALARAETAEQRVKELESKLADVVPTAEPQGVCVPNRDEWAAITTLMHISGGKPLDIVARGLITRANTAEAELERVRGEIGDAHLDGHGGVPHRAVAELVRLHGELYDDSSRHADIVRAWEDDKRAADDEAGRLTEHNERLKADIDRLRKERNGMVRRAEEIAAERDAALADNARLRGEIDIEIAGYTSLQAERDAAIKRAEDTLVACGQLQAANGREYQRAIKAEAERDELRDKLTNRVNALLTQDGIIDELRARAEKLETNNDRLRKERDATIDKYEELVDALTTERDAAIKAKEEAVYALDREHQRYLRWQEEAHALRERVKEMEGIITDLLRKGDRMPSKEAVPFVVYMRQKLRTAIAPDSPAPDKEGECEGCTKCVDDRVASLEERLAESHQALDRVATERDDKYSDVARLLAERDAALADNDRLRKERDATIDKYEELVDALTTERDAAIKRAEEAEARHERLQNSLKDHIQSGINQRDALRERVKELEGKLRMVGLHVYGECDCPSARYCLDTISGPDDGKTPRDHCAHAAQCIRTECKDCDSYQALLEPAPDSPAPETKETLCETCQNGMGKPRGCNAYGLEQTDCDHYLPPAQPEGLPRCPQCGEKPQKHPLKPGLICRTAECNTDASGFEVYRTRDEWLRHCAENTPCRECGELPKWGTGVMEHENEIGDGLCCGCCGPCTPAEWLAKQGEGDGKGNDGDDAGGCKTSGQGDDMQPAQIAAPDDHQPGPEVPTLRQVTPALQRADKGEGDVGNQNADDPSSDGRAGACTGAAGTSDGGRARRNRREEDRFPGAASMEGNTDRRGLDGNRRDCPRASGVTPALQRAREAMAMREEHQHERKEKPFHASTRMDDMEIADACVCAAIDAILEALTELHTRVDELDSKWYSSHVMPTHTK